LNYYEEFGVISNASTEDIRQAYKVLARLLHPDAQVDERLRAAAERQMRRINEILAVLTDPRRRREYDDRLRAPQRLPIARRYKVAVPAATRRGAWKGIAARYWYAILIALSFAAAGIAWYAVAGSTTDALPMDGAALFHGRWLYAGNGAAYMECVLQQDLDRVRGTCRERNSKPAPEIIMEVSGRAASPKSAQLAWAGGDGAAGAMELTVETAERMRGSWWTVREGRVGAPSRGDGWFIRQEAR
jgi:hypothetical protein